MLRETLPPPATTGRAPARAAPARTTPSIAERMRAAVAGTPGTLRVLGTVLVIGLLLFGLLGSVAAGTRADALDRAQDASAQLVRLQTIRTNLVEADANATNAFLVGGLEPPAQRVAYEQGIATATTTLSQAAALGSGDDADTLGAVNEAVARYTGLVESARANNRQGFPIGVAYLRQASALVRTDVLPALSDLVVTTQERVDDAYSDSRSAEELLWTGVLLAVIVLVAAQGYLSVRMRRLVSIPIAIAAAIVLAATVLGGGAMAWAQWRADDVRDGPYRRTVALTQARIDAFDAKSAESFTLIARGSGQESEERFIQVSDSAITVLREGEEFGVPSEVGDAFQVYLDVHDEIRVADDGGDWDRAVELATSDQPDGANAAFQQFDDLSRAALDDNASTIADDLDEAKAPLGPMRILLLIAGVAAAIAGWQGISARLREYR